MAREYPASADYKLMGRTLHALIRVAAELGDHEAADDGRNIYETAGLADGTRRGAVPHPARHGVGSLHARRFGSRAVALPGFQKVAPSDAWRVMSHVDRAYVARMNRNEPWARDELMQAQAQGRSVVWDATTGEERQALVTLAVLFAPVDMGQAQRYVSNYMRMGKDSVDPTLAIAHDRRANGFTHTLRAA